jgi:hypothetical protein
VKLYPSPLRVALGFCTVNICNWKRRCGTGKRTAMQRHEVELHVVMFTDIGAVIGYMQCLSYVAVSVSRSASQRSLSDFDCKVVSFSCDCSASLISIALRTSVKLLIGRSSRYA